MCFSSRRAIQSLKQKDCVVRGLDLSPLCGTTTISMVLIIIGHRWGFRLPGPLQNYEANEQVRISYDNVASWTDHIVYCVRQCYWNVYIINNWTRDGLSAGVLWLLHFDIYIAHGLISGYVFRHKRSANDSNPSRPARFVIHQSLQSIGVQILQVKRLH